MVGHGFNRAANRTETDSPTYFSHSKREELRLLLLHLYHAEAVGNRAEFRFEEILIKPVFG